MPAAYRRSMDEGNGASAELRIVGAERPGGLELRTSGLAARGLPELRVTALPPYLGQGWARVLADVARRLAGAPFGPGTAPPDEVVLDHGVALGLVADADEPGVLAVRPPDGHEGSPEAWRRDVLVRLFPAASV